MPDTVLHTDQGGELVVQGGPRPYLWIGGKDNRCVGTVETDLRALRDALTVALRDARREAMADA